MKNEKKIVTDLISSKVNYYVDAKQSLVADVIAQDICDDYDHEVNDDALLHRFCTYGYIKENVIRFLTKNYDNPDKQGDPNQQVIEGWEYLQSHYFVERDGERKCIYIYDTTSKERQKIARRLKSKGRGMIKHGEEMQAFDAMVTTLFTV